MTAITPRRLAAAAMVVLVAGAGWWWWGRQRVILYGGIKPYMKRLRELHEATATAIAQGESLPLDFVEMEQLAQTAQDIFAVFANDPRRLDPRFPSNATELMRRGSLLEHAWDSGRTQEAKEAFAEMTDACNRCHEQLADGKPPKLTFSP